MSHGKPFRVTWNGEFTAHLDLLVMQAGKAGIYDRVKKALLEIEGHLELHPMTWGDPFRRYDSLELTVFHRIHDEMSVVYSVHDSDGFVWCTQCTPILTHPLVSDE